MRPHLASLVEDWRRNGKDTAVVAHRGNRAFRTTYGSLAQMAGRFAAELQARGIGSGERVVLWGENSAEWIAAFFGCVLRGVIAVPLDVTGAPEFTNRVLQEVSPRLLVGDGRLLARIEATLPRMELRGLEQSLPAEPLFAVASEVTLDSPLQIVFTSGTTSEPKGVVHTHRNVLASVAPIEREMARYLRYERPFHPLRFLHTLPLSHVFGQFMGMWLPPLLSAEVHFIDGVEPGRLVSTIKRERVSVLVAVPRILELIRVHLLVKFPSLNADLLRSVDIPAWKRWWRFRAVHRALGFKFWALICGGATLPAELEAFWNGLGLAVVQGYGMTETAALVTLNHPLHVGKGTLGKALPGREVRLTPEGEIEVRGDMLAAGSWQNGAFQPRTSEWLATGDLGMQEASGELRFAGRKGDVIVTAAGLNVYPQDLEAALLAQPGVRARVVVGCETPRGSEPVAVVVFDGDDAQMRAALEGANARLAAFQQMGYVLRWPEASLPYTATGKLLRRRVAAWACEQIAPGVAADGAGREVGDPLLALIAEVTGERVAGASDPLRLTEDLHLDSLGRVQLQSALEARMGVEVPDDVIASVATLGELRRLVAGDSVLMCGSGDGADRRAEQQVPFGDDRKKSKREEKSKCEEQGAFSERGRSNNGGPWTAFANGEQAQVAVGSNGVGRERISYPRWPWSRPMQWIRAAFLEAIAMLLVRFLAKPRVVREGTAELRGPMLVIANHVNAYDMPLVLYALPGPVRRRVAAAMSAEVLGDLRYGRNQGNWALNLLARPAAWLLVSLLNVFPLPRLSGFRRSFAHAGEALDRGYSVLVFPEGRRSQTGEMAAFRPGIGLLVQASEVPVLPVALQGMGTAARGGRRWFRTGRIAVRVGEPVRFGPEASAEEITQRLQESLRALNPS